MSRIVGQITRMLRPPRAITRREVLAHGLAAAAAVSAGCRPGGSGGPRLRIMLNGGIYEELARRLVVEPFERETGVAVDVVPGSAAEILTRVRAERASPTVDLVVIDRLVVGDTLDAGLFERIDPGNVPNLAQLAPEALDPQGFGPVVHAHNLALGYNTSRLTVEPPRSWADLWDARFRGLVVPAIVELTPGLLFLLQANTLHGGSYDNLDPGFAAMQQLRPNLRRFYRSIGEVRPILGSENAIVAVSTNVIQGEIARGGAVGVAFPEEGCLASPAVAQVVKGTRMKALAERFIDFYLRAEAQTGWATSYFVTVFNRQAAVPASVRAQIGEKVVLFDADRVSRGRQAWIDRWAREVRG